jgi:hypothetical protein
MPTMMWVDKKGFKLSSAAIILGIIKSIFEKLPWSVDPDSPEPLFLSTPCEFRRD